MVRAAAIRAAMPASKQLAGCRLQFDTVWPDSNGKYPGDQSFGVAVRAACSASILPIAACGSLREP